MRNVINKNVTEEEVLATCRTAFEGGYTSVKLYFMMGLPTETKEDIEGVVDAGAESGGFILQPARISPRGKGLTVTVSVGLLCAEAFYALRVRAAGYRGNAAGKAASYGRI